MPMIYRTPARCCCLLPTLLLILLLSAPAGAQGFRAGAALRVITPDPLLPVSGGIGVPKPARVKKGDLYARALVLENNGVRVAIVSVDNLGWPAVLGDRSRALIHGIPPENILIGATHTHSAPDAYGFPDSTGHSSVDLAYLDHCVQLIAEAVNEAVSKLRPAVLKIAVGEAQGKIAYNYYAPDLYDPRCGVIQALGTDGRPIATLVNYAIHPEIIGSAQGILSPDLCGPLYDRIAARGGGMAIFMNGAQGGMVTADNRRPGGKESRDWSECIRIGQLLADEALRIVAPAPLQRDPDLQCASLVMGLPVESPEMQYIFRHSPVHFTGMHHDTVDTRLNLLVIGTAQVLTVPGEALPNIGYYVKRHMRTEQPFLFGLTNDAFGYILDKVDFNSFKRYRYISRTSLGEMTGDIYINTVLPWLAKGPAPAGSRP